MHGSSDEWATPDRGRAGARRTKGRMVVDGMGMLESTWGDNAVRGARWQRRAPVASGAGGDQTGVPTGNHGLILPRSDSWRWSMPEPPADSADGASGESQRAETVTPTRDGIVAHCAACRCERVFHLHRIRHRMHLLWTVLTGGIWLLPWLAFCIETTLRPWRCTVCGWHKPEFRVPIREALEMGEAALHQRGREARKKDAP